MLSIKCISAVHAMLFFLSLEPIEAGKQNYYSLLVPYYLRTYLKQKLTWEQKTFLREFCAFNKTLLDLGCGEGIFLKEAELRGFQVYGVDFDNGAIKSTVKN